MRFYRNLPMLPLTQVDLAWGEIFDAHNLGWVHFGLFIKGRALAENLDQAVLRAVFGQAGQFKT